MTEAYKWGFHSGKLTAKDVLVKDTLEIRGNMTFGDASADTFTVTGRLTVNGGMVLKRVSKSSNYTAAVTDSIIGVDTSSSAVTITLPSTGAIAGKVFIIADEGGNAGSNNITVATEGSETIDGSATATISSNYGALRIYSDGTNFFTF